ncbi:uncharacterized protein VTP21DRAFT_5092 [Calcarisporiella thermophila]|uniref:uncharacterized protein n=1 Tax=Calcarisporiella thermophila TaxID=911321 RepID=UPI003744AA61
MYYGMKVSIAFFLGGKGEGGGRRGAEGKAKGIRGVEMERPKPNTTVNRGKRAQCSPMKPRRNRREMAEGLST